LPASRMSKVLLISMLYQIKFYLFELFAQKKVNLVPATNIN